MKGFKFRRILISILVFQLDKYTVIGGLAEVGAHLSLSHVLKYTVGSNPVLQIKDDQGRYVWGIGGDNMINAAIGGGLWFFGKRKNNKKLKAMGEGWLFAFGITKLSELWLYLTAIDPIPETQMLGPSSGLKTQMQVTSSSSSRYNIAPAKTGAYR